MVKEVYFFTEMGYTAYPQDDARRRGYNNLMLPNEHFRPERAREVRHVLRRARVLKEPTWT